jgi:hypothetical protein
VQPAQVPVLTRLLEFNSELDAPLILECLGLGGQLRLELGGAHLQLALEGRQFPLASPARKQHFIDQIFASMGETVAFQFALGQIVQQGFAYLDDGLTLSEEGGGVFFVGQPEAGELDRVEPVFRTVRWSKAGDVVESTLQIFAVLHLDGFAVIGTHRARLEQLECDQGQEEHAERGLGEALDRFEVGHALFLRAVLERLERLGAGGEGQTWRIGFELLGGELGGDAVDAPLVFRAEPLQGLGAFAQRALPVVETLVEFAHTCVEFRLFGLQLASQQLGIGLPFARLGSAALGASVTSQDLVADALLGGDQIAAQQLQFGRELGLDLGAALALARDRFGQTLDLACQRLDTRTMILLDLGRARGDLGLELDVTFVVVLFDPLLMVGRNVVGADQLAEEGRGDIEREGDDGQPGEKTEQPAHQGEESLIGARIPAARARHRALGHHQRGIDDPDDREDQHEQQQSGEGPQPGVVLGHDARPDQSPDEAFQGGHQQDDGPGEAQPHPHGGRQQAVAIGFQAQMVPNPSRGEERVGLALHGHRGQSLDGYNEFEVDSLTAFEKSILWSLSVALVQGRSRGLRRAVPRTHHVGLRNAFRGRHFQWID